MNRMLHQVHRMLHLLVGLAIGAGVFGCLGATVADASTPQVTGAATSVSTNSAVLHGTVSASDPDSAWTFQYGTTASYGKLGQWRATGPGTQNVSEQIKGLSPGTTYHFRVVVAQAQGSEPTTYSWGHDQTFTTVPLAFATTGEATSITTRSVLLHGVADTSDPNSGWAFQYGTTRSYGQFSQGGALKPGLTALAANVTGLKPNTLYHYRLIVSQGGSPPTFSPGADRTFRTAPVPIYGTASLLSHRLIVTRGRVAIPIACSGPRRARCDGTISLTTSGKVGTRLAKIGCGSARLVARAGKGHVVRANVGGSCRTLLGKARGHAHSAVFSATFVGGQGPLKVAVTLVGS